MIKKSSKMRSDRDLDLDNDVDIVCDEGLGYLWVLCALRLVA